MNKRTFKIFGRKYQEGYPKPEAFEVRTIEGLRNAQRYVKDMNKSHDDIYYYWYVEESLI